MTSESRTDAPDAGWVFRVGTRENEKRSTARWWFGHSARPLFGLSSCVTLNGIKCAASTSEKPSLSRTRRPQAAQVAIIDFKESFGGRRRSWPAVSRGGDVFVPRYRLSLFVLFVIFCKIPFLRFFVMFCKTLLRDIHLRGQRIPWGHRGAAVPFAQALEVVGQRLQMKRPPNRTRQPTPGARLGSISASLARRGGAGR